MNSRSALRWLAAAGFATPALLAQGQVYIVDAAGGPGSYSTQLQPAIDVAAPGDTILVRGGNYTNASITGKPLALIADTGAIPKLFTLTVQSIPSGTSFVARGLRPRSVVAESCAGTLWFEDCAVAAASGQYPAIQLSACEEVVLNTCSAIGFCDIGGFTGVGFASRGLISSNSTCYASDCLFRGANGCQDLIGSAPTSGADGVVLAGGTAWFSRCELRGGNSYPGFPSCLYFPAPGGDGVVVTAGATLRTLESVASGGYGYACSTQVTIPPTGGVPYEVSSGAQHTPLAGQGCRWSVKSPAREFQLVSAQLDAEPGALAFLAISVAPAGYYFDVFQGPQLVSFPWFGIVLGIVPASGTAMLQSPFGALPTGIDGQSFYSQSAVLGASGTLQACGSSAFLVLEQSL